MEGHAAPDRPTYRSPRLTDWRKVLAVLDDNPGTAVCVGVMDQSMRTHIRKGRFSYIDPDAYDVWTEGTGEGTKARLFMRKRVT